MAYKIDEKKCIGCGSCAGACPAMAIKKEGEKYKIDPNVCLSCGVCASVCPCGAPESK